MDRRIRALLKELERKHGTPVQISLERYKETQQVLEKDFEEIILPVEREVYGSIEMRPCTVAPLPTESLEIKHDLDQVVGRYSSLHHLNGKIKQLPNLSSLCLYGCDFDEGLRNHLATKYEVKEKVVGIAHGGRADWYTVDGVEADLGDWKQKRPDLFQESCRYLEKNNVSFLYHFLAATPDAVFIAEREFHGVEGDVLEHYFGANDLETIYLTQKIADIKIELLK